MVSPTMNGRNNLIEQNEAITRSGRPRCGRPRCGCPEKVHLIISKNTLRESNVALENLLQMEAYSWENQL